MKFFAEKVLAQKQEQQIEKRILTFLFSIILGVVIYNLVVVTCRMIKSNKERDFIKLSHKFKINRTEVLYINGKSWIVRPPHYAEEIESMNKHGYDGYTSCATNQIVYDSTASNIHEVLWHEVFHAGECNTGRYYWNNQIVSDSDHENHSGVYHLGVFMTDFSRANLEFMAWESSSEDE